MTFLANLPFSIAFLALLLWLLLWGCKKMLFRWMQGKKTHKISTFYFPIIAHFVWLLFAGYSVFKFTKLNPLVTLIVLGTLLFLGRRFLQNFFVGILFRLEKKDLRGISFLIDGQEGVIVAYGLTTVSLKSNGGSWLYIPYEQLYKQGFVRTVKVAHSDNVETLKVNFDRDVVLKVELLEAIRRKLLLNPYIAAGDRVRVTKGKDENEQWILLNYKLLNHEQSGLVKQELEEAICNMKVE